MSCYSVEGELVEHDLCYLLVILGFILLSSRWVGLILLRFFLFLIVLLLFLLRGFLLFLWSLFLRLGPRLTLFNLDPYAQKEDAITIGKQRGRFVEVDQRLQSIQGGTEELHRAFLLQRLSVEHFQYPRVL